MFQREAPDGSTMERPVLPLGALPSDAEDAVQVAMLNNRDLQAIYTDLGVAQADLALAEARLAKATIAAPFPGRVGIRSVSVGAYVNPGDHSRVVNSDSELGSG